MTSTGRGLAARKHQHARARADRDRRDDRRLHRRRAKAPPKCHLRAIGPSLAQSGVTNPLADPTLQLFDGNGNGLEANDNWRTDPDQAESPLPESRRRTSWSRPFSPSIPPGSLHRHRRGQQRGDRRRIGRSLSPSLGSNVGQQKRNKLMRIPSRKLSLALAAPVAICVLRPRAPDRVRPRRERRRRPSLHE